MFDLLVKSAQDFAVPIVILHISWDKTSVSHWLGISNQNTFTSDGQVAWPSVQHWLGTGLMVIRDLMTQTLELSTSGTHTGHLMQTSDMMSNIMHSLGELEAKITVEQGSVWMVTKLVDEEEDEGETLEDEESVLKEDHCH